MRTSITSLIILSHSYARALSTPTGQRALPKTESLSGGIGLAFIHPWCATKTGSIRRFFASNNSKRSNMSDERTTTPASDTTFSGPAVGLRTFTEGKEDGPTIVFVHGWPDDHVVWDKQVAHLKDRYRCVTTDLPGFSGDDVSTEKWGYPTDEVVRRLERTVEAAGNGQPVLLVAHDWGCFYSFKFAEKRPELVSKMVAIDVGGAMKPGPLGAMCMISYQMWLILAFLAGKPIGNWMAGGFARLIDAPNGRRIAKASSCYPYYQVWKHAIRHGAGSMMPDCPLMFIHGRAGMKKIMTFHSDRWLEKVAAKEGSVVVPVDEADHWVHWDAADRVNSELDTFLGGS